MKKKKKINKMAQTIRKFNKMTQTIRKFNKMTQNQQTKFKQRAKGKADVPEGIPQVLSGGP